MPTLEVEPLAADRTSNGLSLQQPVLSNVAAIVANDRELSRQGDISVWADRLKRLPEGSVVLGGKVDGRLAVVTALHIVADNATLEALLQPGTDLDAVLAERHMPLEFPVAVTPWMAVSQTFPSEWSLPLCQAMARHLLRVASAARCTAHAMRVERQGLSWELGSLIGYHLLDAEPPAGQVAWLYNGPNEGFYLRAELLALRAEVGHLPRSQWRGDPSYRIDHGAPRE
ncbi:hypothetical protein M8A51_22980 [Schlegelella sp. S2-27]|uniref:Uncharacterized protein n=1 Tax=Caldimonas mangrovi TaxID=2944811 RepID=A0ABT0YUI2_9BURK|nr:hypothetical protein [Caldimonas mangrovi]MCM5682402.1 hypothetical protein [Caldimonas mangrovi]